MYLYVLANISGFLGLATLLASATGALNGPLPLEGAFVGFFFIASFVLMIAAMFQKDRLSHTHGLP